MLLRGWAAVRGWGREGAGGRREIQNDMNTKKQISLFSQTDVEVPVAAPAYQQQSLFAAFDNTDDFAVHTPYRPDASCSYADGGDALDVENDILEIQDLSSSDGECEDDGRGGHKQKTIYIYIYIYI